MTLVFCDGSKEEVDALKGVLRWFEIVSSLKINYSKCALLGVCMDLDEVSSFASMFGCIVGNFPSMYLGMPLCLGMRRSPYGIELLIVLKRSYHHGKVNIYLWDVASLCSNLFWRVCQLLLVLLQIF